MWIYYSLRLAFFTLPFASFRWLPPIGAFNRPLSAVFFLLAGCLLIWAVAYLNQKTYKGPEFKTISWFVILLLIGIVSLPLVATYGNLKWSFVRLVGYLAIFCYLYMTLYSLYRFGMQKVCYWIAWGYVPAFLFGIIEGLGRPLGVGFLEPLIITIRNIFVIPFSYYPKVALFASEPSYIGYQVVLLIMVAPFIRENRKLYIFFIFGIVWTVVLSKSATVLLIAITYFSGKYLLSSVKSFLFSGVALVFLAFAVYTLLGMFSLGILGESLGRLFILQRDASTIIRATYIMHELYALLDSYGLGWGIGQYTTFVPEITTRHWSPEELDFIRQKHYSTELLSNILAEDTKKKPLNLIVGLGLDFGYAGLGVFGYFIWRCFRNSRTRHEKGVIACALLAFLNIPQVPPYVWVALVMVLYQGKDKWALLETRKKVVSVKKAVPALGS